MKFTKITNSSSNGTLKPYFPGWLKERYNDCFAQISVTTTLKLKNAVKDVARALLGSVPQEIEEWCKRFEMPPQGLDDIKFILGYSNDEGHHQGSIERDEALKAYVNKYPDQWAIVRNALALPRQMGRHASAFVLASKPISDFIPLTTVGGVKVTAYDGTAVENVGGLKLDWLVVNILNDIQGCIALINKDQLPINDNSILLHRSVKNPVDNKYYDIWNLPQDLNVFNDVSQGKTETVFQFNTHGAVRWLKHFNYNRPDGTPAINSIYSMAVFTALDRPGPLNYNVTNPQNGQKHNIMVEYARRIRGLPGSKDILPIFDELLPETNSLIVFQEQLQRIYQNLTGCTGAEAEAFRGNVAKKKKEKVDAAYKFFIEKASIKLGMDNAIAVWQGLVTFAEYGFNCFGADQLILTDSGYKKISEITKEKIASFDGSRVIFEKPKNIWVSGQKEVFEVTLEDDSIILCTEDHLFLNDKDKWVEMKELIKQNEIYVLEKERITCKCGCNITPNTFYIHLHSKRCKLTEEEKKPIIELINLCRKHEYAWLKSEGEEAVFNYKWFVSVYENKTKLTDWAFESPRCINCVRPSAVKRFSEERKGANNPMVKTAPIYDISVIKNECKNQFSRLGTELKGVADVIKEVNKEYPKFMYSLHNMFPNKQRYSHFAAWVLDLTFKEAVSYLRKCRGKFISKGQKGSKTFSKIASALASKLNSGWRISKGHKQLYELVIQYDPNSTIEYRIEFNNRSYSYDIYSLKYNALIEMHGDFWHKPPNDKTTHPTIISKINHNLKNDIVKSNIAIELNFNFWVFWESQSEYWIEQLMDKINETAKN